MNRKLEIKATQSMKNWVMEDSFLCAIHIAPGAYSQKQLLEVLGKYVKAKLNKYLVGKGWQKSHNSKHLQIFWFKEGQDIKGNGLRGYYNEQTAINTTLKLNSDKQSHYHCLVKCGENLKNTVVTCGVNLKNNESLLVELTLREIFREFNLAHSDRALDVKIRNCHEADLYQQTYVAKNFDMRNESFGDGKDMYWGIV